MFQHCQRAEQVNIVNRFDIVNIVNHFDIVNIVNLFNIVIIVNECFNVVTELFRSPPQLDEKCLVHIAPKKLDLDNFVLKYGGAIRFVNCRMT